MLEIPVWLLPVVLFFVRPLLHTVIALFALRKCLRSDVPGVVRALNPGRRKCA